VKLLHVAGDSVNCVGQRFGDHRCRIFVKPTHAGRPDG
jgi:hypothetical protein